MADDHEQEDTAVVEEEYAVWKKYTPFLYDLIISHPLEWPSLTVHWVPSAPQPYSDPSLAVHKLILGTHTSDDYPNYLMVADALLPASQPNVDAVSDEPTLPKVEISQKIRVDGEVNRARCMLQKPNMVGAKTSGSEVYVFDCTKQGLKSQDGECDPDLRLRGHDKEGYGLSWSPFKEGYLLSGSNDCKICLWDVSALAQDRVLHPMHVYESHESVVNDVSWHSRDENLFGSVGDDCQLMIWDFRTNRAQQTVKVHEKEVNYLSFHPCNEWVLTTASSDTTVGLFDMRKLNVPLHALSGHTEEVFQVEWDPNHDAVLASYAGDRRLIVWDLNRIGDEQLEGDSDDGPPELLFQHGGHQARISDFSWNKEVPWTISSVAEDNTLQVWQMADGIYGDDDVQEGEASDLRAGCEADVRTRHPFSTLRRRRRCASTPEDSTSVPDHFPFLASPFFSSFPVRSLKTSNKVDLAGKLETNGLAGEGKWSGRLLESSGVEARGRPRRTVENRETSAL
ncbi:hypothetical protein ACLB2K_012415 [Fragaria x ananassa]